MVLLYCADRDSGTSAELGYLYELGKPFIGIMDDKRANLNNIIWGIKYYEKQIKRTKDQLLAMMQSM